MTGCLDVQPGDPVDRLGLGVVALKYQALGFAVLGLEPLAKRPSKLVEHGVLWADTDPAAVHWLWSRQPKAGIGLATGAASGVIVIDLDRHGGAQDGVRTWQDFLAQNGLSVPPGPWVQTPSGGEHHYYRLPPGADLPGRRDILDGVDVKASGGYVGAPPSMVLVTYDDPRKPGRVKIPYVMHGCLCSIPPAPDWMLTWALSAPTAGSSGEHSATSESGALPDLESHYAGGLPVGLRNIVLMQLACQLFARYGSHDPHGQAREAIGRVLAATDQSGFGGAEQERTIASAQAFIARREQEDAEAAASVPPWWERPGVAWHR